jgi:hypothetical protein
MFNDRRTRFDDKLFLVLLILPALVAGARFLESKSEMDQIALQNNKQPVLMVAKASTPTPLTDKAAGIVHRF